MTQWKHSFNEIYHTFTEVYHTFTEDYHTMKTFINGSLSYI